MIALSGLPQPCHTAAFRVEEMSIIGIRFGGISTPRFPLTSSTSEIPFAHSCAHTLRETKLILTPCPALLLAGWLGAWHFVQLGRALCFLHIAFVWEVFTKMKQVFKEACLLETWIYS